MPAPDQTTEKANEDEVVVEIIQERSAREIEQIDHLNKKLLISLFKRLEELDTKVAETKMSIEKVKNMTLEDMEDVMTTDDENENENEWSDGD